MGCKNVVKAIEMVQFGRKFREKSDETHVPTLR